MDYQAKVIIRLLKLCSWERTHQASLPPSTQHLNALDNSNPWSPSNKGNQLTPKSNNPFHLIDTSLPSQPPSQPTSIYSPSWTQAQQQQQRDQAKVPSISSFRALHNEGNQAATQSNNPFHLIDSSIPSQLPPQPKSSSSPPWAQVQQQQQRNQAAVSVNLSAQVPMPGRAVGLGTMIEAGGQALEGGKALGGLVPAE